MTLEAKKKAAEAKSRADEAFKQKDFLMAVNAYTQVPTLFFGSSGIIGSLHIRDTENY